MAGNLANLRPWQPGQSGNPAGRPIGSRHKLAEQFIKDAYELWKIEGPAALLQLRRAPRSLAGCTRCPDASRRPVLS
jgi:uncharacterized protein DUF5681